MLMRTDPIRDLERLAQRLPGSTAVLDPLPMDARRDGDVVNMEFNLPGISPNSTDLDVERNVATDPAEREPLAENAAILAAYAPAGPTTGNWSLARTSITDTTEPPMTTGCRSCASRSLSGMRKTGATAKKSNSEQHEINA
ncbi:hypothetical protein [Paeniglutamicibacter sp. Y32M11]|uniref:hypothetical protein n=1 Tax=Paeniglutamicibacter sp. Y32M11 TaxID=2853258 RepID=UPI002106179F|nr:hypothetical protein [Paeniglutamicibacter sp. Y32M11]